ncbi:hypothetical protein AQY21_11640 [Paracoccus sp. MKU1]|nr:hypothetical protein AQY21_11640 [Paracoccus sp. MKU1]
MLRATPVVQGIRAGLDHIVGEAALPCLDRIPDVLVDEPQVRHLMDDPFAFRVQAGYAPASVGILDIA